MDRHFLGMNWEASQIQSVNPIFVLGLIPLFSMLIYPFFAKLGFQVTPLRKMTVGMFMAALSFVIVAVAQSFIDSGQTVNVGWQVAAFFVLTISEIMVSITGLEFAYTQAPRAMKSTIMSFWLLTVAGGNLFTAFFSLLNRFHGATEFWFYTVMMFLVSFVFMALASRYKERNFLEEAL